MQSTIHIPHIFHSRAYTSASIISEAQSFSSILILILIMLPRPPPSGDDWPYMNASQRLVNELGRSRRKQCIATCSSLDTKSARLLPSLLILQVQVNSQDGTWRDRRVRNHQVKRVRAHQVKREEGQVQSSPLTQTSTNRDFITFRTA